MEKKENQRIALTKRLLKEALLKLMETKNIQKISVSELCKEAGINRVTFYNHYSSPSDILAEMGDGLILGMQDASKEKSKMKTLTLQERVETACEYLQKNKKAAKILFENNTPDSEFGAKLIRGQDGWQTLCSALGEKYGEAGKELILTFVVYGAYCMITKWLLDDIKKTPKEMGQLIAGLNINGFSI